MRKGIKYRIGKRILLKLVSAKSKSKIFLPFQQAKDFIVLWDETQNVTDKKFIQQFLEYLNQSGKRVYRVIYHHSSKLDKPTRSQDGMVYHFCRKDFNRLGLPKTMDVKKIIAQPFDYMINMNLDGRLPISSIVAFANSAVRVGHRNYAGLGFYDLLLGEYDNFNQENFVQDLKTYLQKIG